MNEILPKLSGKQARYLRSLGHSLKPLIQVGKSGITDNFINQVRSALNTHELIKVKLGKNTVVDKELAVQKLTSEVPCQLAQSIGKTLLIYKPRDEEPTIVLPD